MLGRSLGTGLPTTQKKIIRDHSVSGLRYQITAITHRTTLSQTIVNAALTAKKMTSPMPLPPVGT